MSENQIIGTPEDIVGNFFFINGGSTSIKVSFIEVKITNDGVEYETLHNMKFNLKVDSIDEKKLENAFTQEEIFKYLNTNYESIENKKVKVIFAATAGLRRLDDAAQKARLAIVRRSLEKLQTQFANLEIHSVKVLDAFEEGLYAYLSANANALIGSSASAGSSSDKALYRVLEIGGYSAQIATEEHQCLVSHSKNKKENSTKNASPLTSGESKTKAISADSFDQDTTLAAPSFDDHNDGNSEDSFVLNKNETCYVIAYGGQQRGVRVQSLEVCGVDRAKKDRLIQASCPVTVGETFYSGYNSETFGKCRKAVHEVLGKSLESYRSLLPILPNLKTIVLGSPAHTHHALGFNTKEDVPQESPWITKNFMANLKKTCAEKDKHAIFDVCFQGIFNTEFFSNTKSLHANHILVKRKDLSWELGMAIEASSPNFKVINVQHIKKEVPKPGFPPHAWIYLCIVIFFTAVFVIAVVLLLRKIKMQKRKVDGV